MNSFHSPVFVIILTATLTILQAFVFNTFLDLIFADTIWWLVLLAAFILAVVSMYFYHQSRLSDDSTVDKLYYLINSWWGLLLNLSVASIFYWPVVILTGQPIIGGLILLAGIGMYYYGANRAKDITIKHLEIPIANLPNAWNGKKLAFISDLHIGKIIDKPFVNKVLDIIDKHSPEALLIGGDLFDSTHAPWEEILTPFKTYNFNKGIFYVTGNHEYFIDYETKLKPIVQRLDFNLLENTTVEIDGLHITGISHRLSRPDFNFIKSFDELQLDPNNPNILLYHEPSPLDSKYALKNGISLQLSGHTHFGQIAPFNIVTWVYYGHFDYGLYFDKKTKNYQYTSSGAGSWGPPVRTTAKPEAVIITLVSQDQS